MRLKREKVLMRDADILGGTPVFSGTRVPIHSLIDHLASGVPLGEFLDDFPSVNREQAVAFLSMAEQSVLKESFHASFTR